MTNGVKKGSIEDALIFWREQAPDLEHTLNGLLTDIYNFQAVGSASMVMRSILTKEGKMLRIYGRLD